MVVKFEALLLLIHSFIQMLGKIYKNLLLSDLPNSSPHLKPSLTLTFPNKPFLTPPSLLIPANLRPIALAHIYLIPLHTKPFTSSYDLNATSSDPLDPEGGWCYQPYFKSEVISSERASDLSRVTQ